MLKPIALSLIFASAVLTGCMNNESKPDMMDDGMMKHDSMKGDMMNKETMKKESMKGDMMDDGEKMDKM